MITVKAAGSNAFESIKQKYTMKKENNCSTASPLNTRSPLKAENNSYNHTKEFLINQRRQNSYVSPLKLKQNNVSQRSAKQWDSFELNIDRIREKLKNYQTVRPEMTDRQSSQRALNKQSAPISKRFYLNSQNQEEGDYYAFKSKPIQYPVTNYTIKEVSRSSPIKRYWDSKGKEEGLVKKGQNWVSVEERATRCRQEREATQKTIMSIESIMNNIRCTLGGSYSIC